MDIITKDFIRTHIFESDGINFPDEDKNFRLREGMNLPPSEEENFICLRKQISEIYYKQYENFAQLESRCDINESTMRKYLNGRRKITRVALAKFCVGTKLTVEQSNELFILQGHSLEIDTNRLDALVVNALQEGDDIDIFFDTCEEVGLKID